MSRAEPPVPTREERERRIVEIAAFRVRRLGDHVRHMAGWHDGFANRKEAREAARKEAAKAAYWRAS